MLIAMAVTNPIRMSIGRCIPDSPNRPGLVLWDARLIDEALACLVSSYL
ncbi:MAG: hypothetical protein ACYDBA_12345 [Sulfuricaulis sp.]